MTTEQKFHAAVNVIRSLPKNGSYQPSNDLMLRFYSYFKQATQGPCIGGRPAFWDIVGRAKYDAWKRLGDMTKEEAMAKYVDELHTIVETMSYSDKVANFLEAPSNELDTISIDDLELVAGDVIERVRSQPNSPIASREGSPIIFGSHSSANSSPSISPSFPAEESDHSDDEYIDTIENPEPRKPTTGSIPCSELIPNGNIHTNQIQHVSRSRTRSQSNTDISQEISSTVQNLRVEIERLNSRVVVIENANKNVKVLQKQRGLFGGLPTRVIIFILTWPIVAHFIINRLTSKRK